MAVVRRAISRVSLLALCTASGVGLSQDHAHVVVSPDAIEWGPASPKLPPGARVAVLAGNPSVPGEPYVFRVKLPDAFSVPPHWHPMDENVTVLQGVMTLGFGERFDEAALRELPAGSYATLPKEQPHFNRMKGETILQFHGIGPYDIVYVSPGDDPSRRER
jgi:quercetin dioxygenase-like cupin family protein